jgi:hypothetical protein
MKYISYHQMITGNTEHQNIGSPVNDRSVEVGNLSVENPTIEQMNASFFGASQTQTAQTDAEPIFGAHLREAAGTVRKLFGQ